MAFNIDQHARDLLSSGFPQWRVDKWLELARAGKLRRAFKLLNKNVCGARRVYGRGICFAKPMANGRCKFHGGCSTGAKTAEGRARQSEGMKRYWRKWREAKEYAAIFD